MKAPILSVPAAGFPPRSGLAARHATVRFAAIAKWLFDFYIFSNAHIAFCAVAFTLTTQAVFHLSLRSELLVFVFCGTFFGYNLQRLPSAFENDPMQGGCGRSHWNTKHRILLTMLSVLAAIAFTWSASRLYLRSQIVAVIPAVLSFAYAFPVIPTGRKWIQLREIPGLKIFVIAVTWVCSCVLLPIASVQRAGEPWFSFAAVLWTLACGLLIFSLTIPFDIRDLRYDAKGLKTLPARLGVRRSIFVAIGALMVSASIPWMNWRYLHTGTGPQALAYSALCLVASFFIYKTSPERHEYYFSFAIDGLIVLLWGMIWLTSHATLGQ